MVTERLDLLLADVEGPVLPGGLRAKSLLGAPRPRGRGGPRPRLYRADFASDPNDLSLQRWGVVAPLGSTGDAALDAIAKLRVARAEEQGVKADVYRVPPGQSAESAFEWRRKTYLDEEQSEEDRARYLLLLGDFDGASLELQRVLSQGTFVGRLCCRTPEGYPAYAEKAVAAGRGGMPHSLRLFCSNDGTPATVAAKDLLVDPAEAQCRASSDLKSLQIANIPGTRVADLADAARAPGILLSVTHGAGMPPAGSPEERKRARLGAPTLFGEALSAEALGEGAFVPGGAWFCLACFGGGCPRESVFRAWLQTLHEARVPGVERLLQRLGSGTSPFVAALPQALLASPLGPVSIVAHVDLAWTYAFTDAAASNQSRASRIVSVLRALATRRRAGVAFDALMRALNMEADELMADYEAEENAAARHEKYDVKAALRSYRWMARSDLQGYLLFGDPAVQVAG